MNVKPKCPFFNVGYCKYKDKCSKEHANLECSDQECKDKNCAKTQKTMQTWINMLLSEEEQMPVQA